MYISVLIRKDFYEIFIDSEWLLVRTTCTKHVYWLVSTYVVCERLSVMHEPAGVVEILVQILQFTPIL